jgi:hypothetical protein
VPRRRIRQLLYHGPRDEDPPTRTTRAQGTALFQSRGPTREDGRAIYKMVRDSRAITSPGTLAMLYRYSIPSPLK